jgi:hypothetical protein
VLAESAALFSLQPDGELTMRIKSSQTLVLSPQGEEIVAFNFLTKSIFACAPDTLNMLQSLSD